MKRILFIAALFLQLQLSAQEATIPVYHNTVSVAPFGLLFGNLQVSYERAITSSSSVELEAGLKMSGGLLKINGFDSPTLQTNDFEFTGITLTPGYRWYPLKGSRSHTGFYLGGYYRFRAVGDNVEGNYTSSKTGTDSPVDLDVKLVTSTVGFQLGYKLPIHKHFSVDFLFAGPGLSFGTLSVNENQPLPEEFFTDAENAIRNNLSFLDPYLENIKFKGTGDLSSEADVTLPAFRYSIKIGYSF